MGALILGPLFVLSIHLGSKIFGGRLQGFYRFVVLAFLALVALTGIAL